MDNNSVRYDYSQITVINHDHRRALNLSIEDYIVMQEFASNNCMMEAERIEFITTKTGFSFQRVQIILSKLRIFNLLINTNSGYMINARWFETISK